MGRTYDKPWHGVHVATTLQFKDDYSVDYDAFAEHVQFLAANGCQGVAANGSLGEYQTLSDVERAQVIKTAVEAAPEGFHVMAGVGAYGGLQSRHWAEQAAEAGADSVMLLPPNTYRADEDTVLKHYQEVAKAGLPIVGYNNPQDTKVDMQPAFLARLHEEGLMVGVKEFTGDPRRIYAIKELAPELDILIGTDDSILEVGIAGAVGWVAGYTNAIPQTTVEIFELSTSGKGEDWQKAADLYRDLHALLRWDTKTEFVQAIKLSMDIYGLKGGVSRPPRYELPAEMAAAIRKDTEYALSKGYK